MMTTESLPVRRLWENEFDGGWATLPSRTGETPVLQVRKPMC
jgi:hypothetical protein